MEWRVLDIEADPVEQGFALGAFDIIIAANVLHATRDLGTTLGHVGALLRPGGLLLGIETQRQRFLDLIFGTLPGWWLHADHDWRPDHPLMTPARWRDRLAAAGFVAATTLDDAPPGVAATNVVLLANKPDEAAVPEPAPAPSGRPVLLLAAPGDTLAEATAEALRARGEAAFTLAWPVAEGAGADRAAASLRAAGLAGTQPPHLVDLPHGEAAESVPMARLLALAPLLAASEALRGSLDGMALTLVTRDGTAGAPGEAALRAVGRVVANEHPALAVRLVGLGGAAGADGALLAAEIAAPDGAEAEPVLRDGLRHLPRLRPVAPRQASEGARFALEVGRLGALDSLHRQEVEAPAPDAVEVEVRAVGLNASEAVGCRRLPAEPVARPAFRLVAGGPMSLSPE